MTLIPIWIKLGEDKVRVILYTSKVVTLKINLTCSRFSLARSFPGSYTFLDIQYGKFITAEWKPFIFESVTFYNIIAISPHLKIRLFSTPLKCISVERRCKHYSVSGIAESIWNRCLQSDRNCTFSGNISYRLIQLLLRHTVYSITKISFTLWRHLKVTKNLSQNPIQSRLHVHL